MTHFLSRVMLLLFSLFAASLLLIHTLPNHDRDIYNLLFNDNCPLPCFIGIQPNVTTVDDAVKLLENHKWVENIETPYTNFGQSINTLWGYVYWKWKPGSPLWTHTPSFRLRSHDAYLRILDGRVSEIAFSSSLPLGAVILSAGQDGTYILDRPDRYGSKPYSVIQHFYYPKLGLALGSSSTCPALKPDWYQDTVITVWSADYFASFMRILPLSFPKLEQARIIARLQCK